MNVQVTPLSETLYSLTCTLTEQADGNGVNAVVCAGSDGLLLVDTAWPHTAQALEEAVRELGDGPVKLIVVTHPHGDHYGGCRRLSGEATVVAHQQARDEIFGAYFAFSGQPQPIITLEHELAIGFNDQEIRVIPMPGHTAGDVIVYFVGPRVACLGDLVFSDRFPFIDATRGGHVETYIATLGRLIELLPDDVRLVTGHGRQYTLDDLRTYRQMVMATVDLIRQGLAAGQSAQQMAEAGVLRDWQSWSSPQITAAAWIGWVCQTLGGALQQSICEPLSATLLESGVAAAVQQYYQLRQEQAGQFDWSENQLNMLGYQLLFRSMNDEAIRIFQLNVEAYPQSANPYDSLGEAYAAVGDRERAIACYERALELNPSMPSAMAALQTLRGRPSDDQGQP